MCDMCDKYSLKLLTYGSFVSCISHSSLPFHSLTMSIVWRLPVGEVAQQTRAEDILRVNRAHTITTEGKQASTNHRTSNRVSLADEKNATQQYFDMINTWGSWEEFQRLLAVLSTIAQKHGVSLTNVATRWVLQQRAVGAVIVGTRLGVSAHGDENGRVFGFELDDTDLKAINDSALGKDLKKAKPVYEKLGDCGNEYRAMH